MRGAIPIIALLCGLAGPAFAQESAPPQTVAEQPGLAAVATPTRWYGWQTLTVDGIDLVAFPLAAGLTAKVHSLSLGPLIATGSIVYLFGGPILHHLHQDGWGTSASSLGLRAGLPVAGGALGFLIGLPLTNLACSENTNRVDPGGQCVLPLVISTVAGIGAGVVAASILDAAILAREPLDSPPVALAPLILPRNSIFAPRGGAGLALSSRF